MAKRLFGTDGVRGVANTELTPRLAFALGRAAAMFCGDRIVIGRDTRRSGDMLEASLVAGITSAGADALLAGVVPTPAVALLVRELEAAGGIVISASHNPPEYNGIKFFDAQGFKLPDEVEDRIEALLHEEISSVSVRSGMEVGCVREVADARERYVSHAVSTVRGDGLDLSGLKIAVDCGHGASSWTTPAALRDLGAEVVVANDSWNGCDINVGCGSTHPEIVAALVRESGADVGVAHDGDADRMIAVDENGAILDGDFVEAICARDLAARGKLAGRTVVSTVMCNLGFQLAMKGLGINVVQTKVGDRYVLESMRSGGYVLGGEQSGHLIFLEHNTTGDGLVTALQLFAVMKRSGKSLSELAGVMTRFPQTLLNVQVADKHALEGNPVIARAVEMAEHELADSGRVLVRPSGTESLVRVMVEAAQRDEADRVASRLAEVVNTELN